jgi:hypothetical protein
MHFWSERMPYLRDFAKDHRVLHMGPGREESMGVAVDNLRSARGYDDVIGFQIRGRNGRRYTRVPGSNRRRSPGLSDAWYLDRHIRSSGEQRKGTPRQLTLEQLPEEKGFDAQPAICRLSRLAEGGLSVVGRGGTTTTLNGLVQKVFGRAEFHHGVPDPKIPPVRH